MPLVIYPCTDGKLWVSDLDGEVHLELTKSEAFHLSVALMRHVSPDIAMFESWTGREGRIGAAIDVKRPH